MIEQLSSVEGKLVSLAEELSSRDLDTVHKEMEDEEVSCCDIIINHCVLDPRGL